MAELTSANVYHNFGWARVNMQPVKHAVKSYALKWMHTFTKYLLDQVVFHIEILIKMYCALSYGHDRKKYADGM